MTPHHPTPHTTKAEKSEPIRKLLPHIWVLIRPRRWLLALGFVLMAINRVAGLVLPASPKFLFDNIIAKRQSQFLVPLIGAVGAATLVQGVTSYALTQLLSKAAQRMIADLRRQVQAHIGRLPVNYFDANRSGALVSRIMSDVEGVRNLVGTGLVEFAGGLMTAAFAFLILIKINAFMTLLAFGILGGLRAGPSISLQDHAAHIPRAGQNQRRSDGPPYRISGGRARNQGLSCRRPGGKSLRQRRGAATSKCAEDPNRHVRNEPILHHVAGRG